MSPLDVSVGYQLQTSRLSELGREVVIDVTAVLSRSFGSELGFSFMYILLLRYFTNTLTNTIEYKNMKKEHFT